MGALKPWHIIVLVVVLILLFGAKRLPDAARSLGRSMRISRPRPGAWPTTTSPQGGGPVRPPAAADHRTTRPSPLHDRLPTRSARPRQLARRATTVSPAMSRGRPSNFQRAADGSMTLIEHLRELRTRLFRACLAILVGTIVGLPRRRAGPGLPAPSRTATSPRRTRRRRTCAFNADRPARPVPAATEDRALRRPGRSPRRSGSTSCGRSSRPGLHRRERRYTYAFAAMAAPLFAAGFYLGFVLVSRSMLFFLGLEPDYTRDRRPRRLLRASSPA